MSTTISAFAFTWAKLLLLPVAMVTTKTTPTQGRSVGSGDLLIAPGRVVLSDSSRTAEVNLLNIGTTKATYRISLIHERMGVDGQLQEIETAGPASTLPTTSFDSAPAK